MAMAKLLRKSVVFLFSYGTENNDGSQLTVNKQQKEGRVKGMGRQKGRERLLNHGASN